MEVKTYRPTSVLRFFG